VRRRVAHGAFVLSVPGVAGGHYAGALAARERVREDFARVFRRAPADAEAAIAASPLARANAAGRPAAAPGAGVDVLLAPVAPSLPWLLAEEASRSPEQATREDVLTVPASLAHLPAISVPVGSAPFPRALLEAALAGRSAAEAAALRAPLARACRLPVGLQLIGRLCDERTLLRVARALERRAGVSRVDHLAPL
jgi:aspartyl-tRNA(Asn)/glutamyl-tRNA(Gln) amidotransferase subunit A